MKKIKIKDKVECLKVKIYSQSKKIKSISKKNKIIQFQRNKTTKKLST